MESKKVGKIISSQPTGHQVMVELLTSQETLETRLQLSDNVKTDTPQGYVRGIGPMVPKEFGLSIDDRVFISTSVAVMSPGNLGRDGRLLYCVEYNSIKGILKEE
jgi:hypothetical protein